MAQIPWLILHNQLALTKVGSCGNIPSIWWHICLEMRLIIGIFVWKRGSLANSEQKKAAVEDKERAEFLTIVGAVHAWCTGTSASWVLIQNGSWYVTMYILVTTAIFKLSREYKIMDFPRTNRNSMKTETWCWLLCPSTKSRLFTWVPALCLKF